MISDRLYQLLGRWPWVQRQAKRLVLRLPHRLRTIDHLGQRIRIDPSELAGFWLYYEHDYDNFVFEFLKTQIGRYQRAVDIGAHYGIYSIFFGAHVAHVDAFEPVPSIARHLRHNIAINHLTNVTVHEQCVSDRSGRYSFVMPNHQNQGLGRLAIGDEPSVQRPCVSLDDFFATHTSEARLFKIDIEGGEWVILNGATRTWTQPTAPTALLIEVHPEDIRSFGGSVNAFHERLVQMGFTVRGLTPEGLVPISESRFVRFWWAVTGERL